MTEAKIKTRKFRIIGWRKPKRLEDMTVPELMTMRNRAYMLAMSYGGNEKKFAEYERKKALEART